MELYTSLVRLKQAMNGGELPPMTDIPEAVQSFIDPALTIGLGAFEEDAELGLRCPVRGCGEYFHALTRHLDDSHADVGGAARVREALQITRGPSLTSQVARKRRSDSSRRIVREAGKERFANKLRAAQGPRGRRRAGKYASLAGFRNLRNNCDAQMRAKLDALATKLGRSPSINDTIAEYGESLVAAIKRVYGSWDNAKAQWGFATLEGGKPARHTCEAVLRGIRAFHAMHGRLPMVQEADNPTRAPLICCGKATRRALGAATWLDAMERAAALLEVPFVPARQVLYPKIGLAVAPQAIKSGCRSCGGSTRGEGDILCASCWPNVTREEKAAYRAVWNRVRFEDGNPADLDAATERLASCARNRQRRGAA
jgi:hypothetical protein